MADSRIVKRAKREVEQGKATITAHMRRRAATEVQFRKFQEAIFRLRSWARCGYSPLTGEPVSLKTACAEYEELKSKNWSFS